MTISEAIALLDKVKLKHGDVEVYFDCPFCLKSHTPNTVTTLAAHLTAKLTP